MTSDERGPQQFPAGAACPACGSPVASSARFCPACGRRLWEPAPEEDIGAWLQAAWRLFVSDIPLAIGISLLTVVPTIVLFLCGYFGVVALAILSDPKSHTPEVVIAAVGACMGLLVLLAAISVPALQAGVYACFLEGIRTGRLTSHHLWSGFRRWWACTWVYWLMSGAMLLCFPFVFLLIGIPMALGLATLAWLSLFHIMDRGEGGIRALSFAWRALFRRPWPLLLYTLLVLAMMSGGAMAMYIGVIVTVPLGSAALAAGYHALSREEQSPPSI